MLYLLINYAHQLYSKLIHFFCHNLINTMLTRDKTLKIIKDLLKDNDFEELRKSHDLFYKRHSSLNLAILHYGKIAKTKKISETDSCRGLVIETTAPFNVVSRGFDRFIPRHEDMKTILNIKKVTVKEDGSMMLLFKYDGKFMLSTMYDFADGPLAFSDKTYTQLFLQIINQPLDDFANSIINQFPNSDNIMTLCFEMCLLENRVIKPYTTPTLFLTSVYGGQDGNDEIEIPDNIQLCPNVNVVEQIKFPSTCTLEEAHNKVKQYCQNDLMFEGFVIQTTENQRIKVKNPYYYTHHYLKYKGWIRCGPEIMIPLIVDKLDEIIINNVVDSSPHDKEFINDELKKRRDYYKLLMDTELDKIKTAISMIVNVVMSGEVMDTTRYAKILKNHDNNLFVKWSGLFFEMARNGFNDYSSFYAYCKLNSNKAFKNYNQFLNESHPLTCCEFTNDHLKLIKENCDKSNGIGNDPYTCYCGNQMKLTELRTELHRYRVCHCGKPYGFLTYNCWTNIMLCTNPSCTCTHEVNTHTKKPLGIPASPLCKNLRLEIHEIINNSGLPKDKCYDIIQKITGRTKETTHMALFGIDDCLKTLELLQKEINVEKDKKNTNNVIV